MSEIAIDLGNKKGVDDRNDSGFRAQGRTSSERDIAALCRASVAEVCKDRWWRRRKSTLDLYLYRTSCISRNRLRCCCTTRVGAGFPGPAGVESLVFTRTARITGEYCTCGSSCHATVGCSNPASATTSGPAHSAASACSRQHHVNFTKSG